MVSVEMDRVEVIEGHQMSVPSEDVHVVVGVHVASVAISGLGLQVMDQAEFIFILLHRLVTVIMFPPPHCLVVRVEAQVAVLDDDAGGKVVWNSLRREAKKSCGNGDDASVVD